MVAFGPEWDVSISLSLQVSGNAMEEEAEEEEPAATEGTEDTSEPCACELTLRRHAQGLSRAAPDELKEAAV